MDEEEERMESHRHGIKQETVRRIAGPERDGMVSVSFHMCSYRHREI